MIAGKRGEYRRIPGKTGGLTGVVFMCCGIYNDDDDDDDNNNNNEVVF